LLWRSITHWMGGMGIIVLGVAILPLIGMGGAQLFRAEVPGIAADRLKPRVATTARLLWGVYALLTVILGILYLLLGMSLFDATNHAMSALATGGFSTRTASMGAYSPAIQWVTIVFMLIAGTNFTLHYQALTGKWFPWIRDAEFRWYAGVAGAAVMAVFLFMGISGEGWILKDAAFNVVAVGTTTGFVTADFGAWPAFCQVLLLGLMFVGAMGGSTGGGFKTARAVVVLKHAVSEVQKVLHPRAIFVTKLGRALIRSDILANVLAFLALYVATHGIGSLLLAALGHDLLTSVSASLAAMSSIGPGLGAVGPASHYGELGSASHIVLSALMLLGRLEFYTLLVLVIPGTWSRWGGDL
jgi:trk system potassium uptake protein TrkH